MTPEGPPLELNGLYGLQIRALLLITDFDRVRAFKDGKIYNLRRKTDGKPDAEMEITPLSPRRQRLRNLHYVLTGGGALGRGIEAFVSRIEYVQLLVFATVLLLLVDGLNFDLRGKHGDATDKYLEIPGRLLIMVVVGAAVALLTQMYRMWKKRYYKRQNHLNRVRFLFIGMLLRNYDPHTDLHEYDYNSDDDPDVASYVLRNRANKRVRALFPQYPQYGKQQLV